MTQPPVPERKAQLRASMRAARAKLEPGQRQGMDAAINRSVIALCEAIGARSVAAYLAFDGEPDLGPALAHFHSAGISIALPVVPRGESPALEFRAWRPGGDLRPNRFGIPEPVDGPVRQLRNCSLALLPLVAWDRHGNRLGMGAGYYDRACGVLPEPGGPLRAGVAYGMQEASEVPAQAWDVPLQAVVNEQGWFIIGSTNRDLPPRETIAT